MSDLFTSEHEDFRKTARTFFEREVVAPPRAVGARRASCRASCGSRPARPGCCASTCPRSTAGRESTDFRYNVVLSEEQTRAGANGPGFSVHTDIIVPYLNSIANEEQKRVGCPAA